jgi:Spy/CpxP family protein refolding chaperone
MKHSFAAAALAAACISPCAPGQTLPTMGDQGTGPGKLDRPVVGQGTIAGINPADLAALDLTEAQRDKVTEIQRDLRRAQWSVTGSIRELRWRQQDIMRAAEFDADAARKTHDAIAGLRKEMFEAALDARKRIEAVLTKQQLELLKQRRMTAPRR